MSPPTRGNATRYAIGSIAALTIVAAAWLGVGSRRFEILTPHLGSPAILRAGEPVEVELLASAPFWRPELEVRIVGRGHDRTVAIDRVSRNLLGTRFRLTFSVPAELPIGGYDLAVDAGAIRRERPGALRVVGAFPNRIRIVQMADLPLLSEGEGGRTMAEVVDELNLVAPDLILLTGDLVYGPSPERYDQMIEYLERLEAPVIVAPGNHEYEAWSLFLRHFVEPWHVVDFGRFYVVSLNSGHGRDQVTRGQLQWLEREMARREGRIPILQIHHPLFGDRVIGRHAREIARMAATRGAPIVLSGHLHGDALFDLSGTPREDTWRFPGPKFAVTTTAGGDLREMEEDGELSYQGYRLVRLDGDEVLSMSYDLDGDGERDAASSYPFGRLRASFPEPRTALVENALNEPMEGVRVAISVPGDEPGLTPDAGRLASVRSEPGATIYSVELDLPAESGVMVRLLEPRGR